MQPKNKMSTTTSNRQAFRDKIEKMIRFANGYYYIGDYQPATGTGRYDTREAAIRYQMDGYDMEHGCNE